MVGVEPARNLRYLNKKKKIDINTIFFNYKNSFKLNILKKNTNLLKL